MHFISSAAVICSSRYIDIAYGGGGALMPCFCVGQEWPLVFNFILFCVCLCCCFVPVCCCCCRPVCFLFCVHCLTGGFHVPGTAVCLSVVWNRPSGALLLGRTWLPPPPSLSLSLSLPSNLPLPVRCVSHCHYSFSTVLTKTINGRRKTRRRKTRRKMK